MKRAVVLLLLVSTFLGVSWAAYQTLAPEGPALSRYFPSGALLYLQAKDFSSLLSDWNGSPQKQSWAKSSNYEVFSRSRLFLRLNAAGDEFKAASGLPPNMNFLTQVAGKQSALAVYDIGKLHFLYISRLPAATSAQTALWQTRSKFETRTVGDVTFYFRRDPESQREVAFAASGDYLLLATREDLLAGALKLMAGSADRSIEADSWWSQPVGAAGPAGDLRMVLNLEKIVPSPCFRSYWIQQNIADMKPYSAAISDLFRDAKEYREERVLLKKSAPGGETSSTDGVTAVADLARLVPSEAGLYEVTANPSPDACFALLETKILAPHLGPSAPQLVAPQVQLTSGETGSSNDLETRIDQAPVRSTVTGDAAAPLKELFQKNQVRAILRVQSTERGKEGVFVRLHSAVALLSASDWNDASIRSLFADLLHPTLTAGKMGVGWQAKPGYQELDGLWTFAVAARGKYLVVSDDSILLSAVLAKWNEKATMKPASFVAGFNQAHEREDFSRLTGLLDRGSSGPGVTPGTEHTPQFFSENLSSLSSSLAAVWSEKIVVREAADKITQTVSYEWQR